MTRILCLSAVVVIGLVATPAALAQPAPKTEKITVQVRPGATTAYLGLVDGKKPAAAVVLLAGGDGVLDLGPAGSIGTDLRLNFLIRSRELFARQGLYPAVLDAPSDREEGMNGAYRLSLQHAGEIGQVIAHLKSRLGVPVWLVGTSSSSLSIVNAAARLPLADLPRPDGVVTTSSMTEPTPYCRKTVFEAQLSAIRVPVLVVSHRDDSCKCSPGSAASGNRFIAALTGASAKERKVFTGGLSPVSAPCHARAPHGFYGIEERVVNSIADWIKAH